MVLTPRCVFSYMAAGLISRIYIVIIVIRLGEKKKKGGRQLQTQFDGCGSRAAARPHTHTPVWTTRCFFYSKGDYHSIVNSNTRLSELS